MLKVPESIPIKAFGKKSDCSGFDSTLLTPRQLKNHRKYAYEHKDAQNLSQGISIEWLSIFGAVEVDPIRMCIIDPTHNLLQGTSEHMMSVWLSLNLIETRRLIEI